MNKFVSFAGHPFFTAAKSLGVLKTSLGEGWSTARAQHAKMVQVHGGSSTKTPEQRFEALYEKEGWDEESLLERQWGLNIARRLAVGAMLLLLILMLSTMFRGQHPAWWQVILFGTSLLSLVMGLGFRAFGNALMIYQLEKRSFLPAKSLLEQDDAIKRVFGW